MPDTTPARVQLRRSRGWRMPANTVKVDRSTRWGNPFKAGTQAAHPVTGQRVTVADKAAAVSLFAAYLSSPAGAPVVAAARVSLRGKALACWCRPGDACHADELARVANALATPAGT